MSLLQAMAFGTQDYPGKVARRLRVLNFACWASAASWLAFAILYFPDTKLRTIATIDVVMAVIVAAIPLLHCFGPRIAGLVFISVSLRGTFAVCFLLGTDTGIQLHFLGYAAGAVLVWGIRPVAPLIAVAVVALVFIVLLEIFAPNDGGLLSGTAMLGGFIGSVRAATAIIVAVVFYAVRETEKAEAVAEFEFARSETLLRNILRDIYRASRNRPFAQRLKSTRSSPLQEPK